MMEKSQDFYEVYSDTSNETNLVEVFDDLFNLDKYNLEYEIFDYSDESLNETNEIQTDETRKTNKTNEIDETNEANETKGQPKSIDFTMETNKSTNDVIGISSNALSMKSLRMRNIFEILIILFLLLQF